MSYYYKYNFISPEPIYAIIKEELKSYFDTGAIDDLMFPTYLNKCLNKLGRTTYSVISKPLYVEDFEARLPDNFYAVKEAWMCSEIPISSYKVDSSFYSQSESCATVQISPVTVDGECYNPICEDVTCGGCAPEIVKAVYKTTGQIDRLYVKKYLLKPGNISAKERCDVSYTDQWRDPESTFSSSYDSFDIRDNKFVTSFRTGIVHLNFYAEDYDELGNQMIPDDYRIKEYVEAFIKYKMFETLFNQTNDETFNQIEKKYMMYKQMSDEAFILASNETKKQTVWEKQRGIIKSKNRLNMYKFPNQRYGRRRNS